MLFPKVVPRHGDVLGGKFVRGGTKIAVDTWSMGRRADIYGEDVDVFRPERFLEVSTQKRAEMVRTAELIFGSGRYTCPGKNMALMELNKVFVEVSFIFKLINFSDSEYRSCSVTLISRLSTPKGRLLFLIVQCSLLGTCG